MKIKFLGSGSAFVLTKENFHSNVLITLSGSIEDEHGVVSEHETNLLIDAGFHLNEMLDFYDLNTTDIKHIFLSHNHGDHNFGLEFLGFQTFFNPDATKPMLFGNTKVLKELWEHVLKGNMGHLSNPHFGEFEEFFDITRIKPRDGFQILGTEFYPVRVPHVIDNEDEVPAFGLKWDYDGIKFFFSGDTQFDFWRLLPFWEYANVIFQDCEFAKYENGVHCQYHQLVDISEKYKKKMWLYHYMLNGKTFEVLEEEVKKDGFAGLVYRGQEFDTEILKEELKNAIS